MKNYILSRVLPLPPKGAVGSGSTIDIQGPTNLWQHNFILKLNILNFML